MALREIITVPDPRLKLVSQPVEKVDDELRALMDDMLETMYAAPGIGLAAIQVGVPKRVIVMDLKSGEEDASDVRHLVNPEITWRSEETVVCEEGCLSVPGVYDEVERPARVRVKYLDYQGSPREEEAEGLFAVCVQHEMEHLEGILFIDHLSRLKRERAVKRVARDMRAA